jgi:hypothetical protein
VNEEALVHWKLSRPKQKQQTNKNDIYKRFCVKRVKSYKVEKIKKKSVGNLRDYLFIN